MAQVVFQHPNINNDLVVSTGANQIMWGYGLNTQVFPTYGGEVVQILSAYIEDLTVEGETRTYRELEDIYSWFLEYMQIATQGDNPDNPSFIETPVRFTYPERGWELFIKPNSLPAFRQGTEVVAPAWRIDCAVVESDPNMAASTLQAAEINNFDFNRLHGGIGYDEDNPFTSIDAADEDFDPEEYLAEVGDEYQRLIKSYLEGDFGFAGEDEDVERGSGPATDESDGEQTSSGGNPIKGSDSPGF